MTTAKMAMVVEDFGFSEEFTVFDSASEEDKQLAKSFWQNVHMMPPMESRLVSSDMRQRLKVATPARQNVNVIHPVQDEKDAARTKTFLDRAEALQQEELRTKLENYSRLREEDLKLLAKRRAERIEKEKISDHKGLPSSKESTASESIKSSENTEDSAEVEQAMREIAEFEQKMGQNDQESDGE